MLSKPSFKLHLKPPEHGWAETTLTLGDTEVFIDASDAGPDSFQQLVGVAIFALTAHSGSQKVEFFEEPAGVVLVVTAEGGSVHLSIGRTKHIVEPYIAPTNEVVSLAMDAKEFARSVWRGLRAHEQVLRDARANEHWREFPEAEMDALEAALATRS